MPTVSVADTSVYNNDDNKPTDGQKLLLDLQSLYTEVNLKETRIANIESNNMAIAGIKTFSAQQIFSAGFKTDTISENTPATGVTIDGVLSKDGFIRANAGASYSPTVAAEIGYDTTTGLFKAYDGAVKPIVLNGGINAQTGTTYTVLAGDRNKLVTLSNASAIAVTLPQAGTTGFLANYVTALSAIGVGTATITPTTSTIDGAATLTLATGQSAIIYSDGTNYFTFKGKATASGLVLLATGTASTSASLDFATIFSSTYDEYLVFWDLLPATDAVNLWMRTSIDSSTFVATGTPYRYAFNSTAATNAILNSAGANQIQLTSSTAGWTIRNTSTEGTSGCLTFFRVKSAALNKYFSWDEYHNNTATQGPIRTIGGGDNAAAAALTGFQILSSSGNLASGTVRVYGVLK